jgi:hypothetical protein
VQEVQEEVLVPIIMEEEEALDGYATAKITAGSGQSIIYTAGMVVW